MNENSYHGPCAPKNTGVHRYIFTIYALNKKIKIDKINGSKNFIDKLNNHKILILSKDSVQFTYSHL